MEGFDGSFRGRVGGCVGRGDRGEDRRDSDEGALFEALHAGEELADGVEGGEGVRRKGSVWMSVYVWDEAEGG